MYLTRREKEMAQADLEGYNAYSPRYPTPNPYTSLDKAKVVAWQAGYDRARNERDRYH